MLTPDQITQYREDGYVIPKWRLSTAELDEIRAAADAGPEPRGGSRAGSESSS